MFYEHNYRTMNRTYTEQRIGRKRKWGLSSKASIFQCQVNEDMTLEGATRGGMRAPNAHDGGVE